MSGKEDVIARRTRSSTKKSSYVDEYIILSDSSNDSSDSKDHRKRKYTRIRVNEDKCSIPNEVLEQRTPRKHKSKVPETELIVNSSVTPPKQQKLTLKQNVLSPSSLLNRLNLSSPQPRSNGDTSKCLFDEDVSFQNARQALHSTIPTFMPGREREHEDLNEFIGGHLNNNTSGTLYISGPPGTGKTASLSIILQKSYVSIT